MHSSTFSSDPVRQRQTNLAAVRRLALSLTVLALAAFAVTEAGLRLAGVSYFNFGTPDADLGWGNRPYAEGIFRKENPAGVHIRINSYGSNDSEHTTVKPDGVFRVAVLGNSYTEAFHVPNEQAYWHVMEQTLNQCLPPGKTRVEVLNFGVSGYGTAQNLILLEKRVWAFQPDLVILGFLTGGDVWYNHRKLQNMDQAPYFVLRHGRLELDDSFRSVVSTGKWRQVQFFMERHLRTLQWATHARAAFRQFQFDVLQSGRGVAAAPAEEPLVKPTDMVYREPASTPEGRIWAEAWEVTEALLVEMDAACRRKGAGFVLVTLTNAAQVHPEEAVREKFRRALGVTDLFYPDRRLHDFAAAHGISVITLAPQMAGRAAREKVYLHGFAGGEPGAGHWNATGNRWVGEAIGKELCEKPADFFIRKGER